MSFSSSDDPTSKNTHTNKKTWFQQNKLACVGGLWLTCMTGTFFWQHVLQNSKTRTSVKVIHSRLYSQAITLSALLAASGVEYYDRRYNNKGSAAVKRTDPFEYKHRRAAAASTDAAASSR
ncbi:unnamed protein product [Bathycoccus prasinos]|jgi:hypothetical protein|tara:strand:- start:1154 stop:1516 length:363 start_codon:yes stop_codon:yes gene_type:complete